MSNTPTSGTSHPASGIQRLTSRISHLTSSITIQLLTAAIKFRKAGLISLLAFFLINCYFVLFDQKTYIMLLEPFSQDGMITDINSVFFKVQVSIFIFAIFWYLIDQTSIDFLEESAYPQKHITWKQRPTPYIFACIIWFLISYLPFLLLDSKTIIYLAKEDSFYEYAGAAWFFIASTTFFYLFSRGIGEYNTIRIYLKQKSFFLLLGLLFLFCAGEEISWGQRVFNIETPAMLSSNFQHEFNLHNLPFFEDRIFDGSRKSGISHYLSMESLFKTFWFSCCVIIPILYRVNSTTRKSLDRIYFPIIPMWMGIFFLSNYFIYKALHPYYNRNAFDGAAPLTEINEAVFPFLFLIIGVWIINNSTIPPKISRATG